MLTRLKPHLSYANVMATVAVFLALGGGAFAAVKLQKNSVKTKIIKNGAVTEPKLAANAVSNGKVADNAITSSKIANGSVGRAKVSASGTATNTSGFNAGAGTCTQIYSIDAPGIQVGDVVAVSFDEINPGALYASVSDGTTGTANQLGLTICNAGGTLFINPGDLKFNWVAFR